MSNSCSNFTFIDLFCGCGGFSLGMELAGFECLAAIDFNSEAIQVFKANFPNVPLVINADLTQFAPDDLALKLEGREVDVIVGGPPCQGFSSARKMGGANHGPRKIEDPRRHLYREFLRFVDHFRPKVFVMENVLGIRNVDGGAYFTRVQAEARQIGYRVVPHLEDATKLGVPQMRKRQLFFGIRSDVPGYMPMDLIPSNRAVLGATLGDAIMDLPPLKADDGAQVMEYDLERRAKHTGGNTKHFIYSVLKVANAEKLTAHVSRPHNERDLRDFAKIGEGETSAQLIRQGVDFEFPYDRTKFVDRYTRQHRDRPCSTIVAHLAKDGLMFIHPTQQRSLTPREAARIQTFPDNFVFPVARTHQFRVIGNAVPPLVGEAVGITVLDFLIQAEKIRDGLIKNILPIPICDTIPSSLKEARQHLSAVATLNQRELRKLSHNSFLKGWHALLYLYPDLHPKNALDHGEASISELNSAIPDHEWGERYLRSRWPVKLTDVGIEVWRRYEAGLLSEEELLCQGAQIKGFSAWSELKQNLQNQQAVS